MSNIYFCMACSQSQGTWVRMEYVKWVFPWQGSDYGAGGDLYRCPSCRGSFVEYSRLHPKPNIHPHEALTAGREMDVLKELMNAWI